MAPHNKDVKMDEYFFCVSECDVHDKTCVDECVEHLHDVSAEKVSQMLPKPQRGVTITAE